MGNRSDSPLGVATQKQDQLNMIWKLTQGWVVRNGAGGPDTEIGAIRRSEDFKHYKKLVVLRYKEKTMDDSETKNPEVFL